MTLQSSPLRAFPTQARVQKVLCLVEEFSSSRVQPLSLLRSLLGVISSLSTLIPGSRLRMHALQHRLQVLRLQALPAELVSWDDSCWRDLRWWSDPSHLVVGVDLALPHPELLLFTDASDTGWGVSLGSDHLSGLWSPDVSLSSINHRELLAIYLAIRRFLHLLRGRSVSLFTDNTTALSYLRKAPRPSTPWLKKSFACASPAECVCSPSLSRGASTSLRTLPAAVLRSSAPSEPSVWMSAWSFSAGDGGLVRHLPQPSPPSLLFAYGGSPGGGGRRDDPIVGSSPGLCLPSFRPHRESSVQSLGLPQPGGDSGGFLLAAPSLVPGPPGPSCGCSGPSSSTQGSSASAPFPSVPPEPQRAGADWVSHCQRSARHFGFSARVARQLAFSRRGSTRVNY